MLAARTLDEARGRGIKICTYNPFDAVVAAAADTCQQDSSAEAQWNSGHREG